MYVRAFFFFFFETAEQLIRCRGLANVDNFDLLVTMLAFNHVY